MNDSNVAQWGTLCKLFSCPYGGPGCWPAIELELNGFYRSSQEGIGMKNAFSFSILRYVHDVVTEEFINVGVVLYCRPLRYLGVLCNSRYRRLSETFKDVNGDHYRDVVRYVEARLEAEGERMATELPFEKLPAGVLEITGRILPPDDTALQFSAERGGLTEDPAKTLDMLYERYVDRYTGKALKPSRTDDEVWHVFKLPLEKHRILAHLQPHQIEGKDYAYEFKNAWKNAQWHLYEPVSFDLLEGESVMEKAIRWVGRVDNLIDGAERNFHLVMLLGSPGTQDVTPAFGKAQNILHKMQCSHEFIREDAAEDFAAHLEQEIKAHG